MGEGEVYSLHLAEDALRADAVNAWVEEAEAANPTKDGFGMKFVG